MYIFAHHRTQLRLRRPAGAGQFLTLLCSLTLLHTFNVLCGFTLLRASTVEVRDRTSAVSPLSVAGLTQLGSTCVPAQRWEFTLTNPGAGTIVRHVPQYHDELDTLLRALADPTRRGVVERLAKSPAVVSELAAPFPMALPSLMQHLNILEQAGVVTSEKHGRVRTVSLRPGALDVLHLWLGEQRSPPERQADRLGIHLTRTTTKEI